MLATKSPKWSSLLLKKTTIYELKISQSMNDSLLSSAPHSYIYILRTFYRDLSHWCRVIKLRNPKIDHENTQRFLRISHSQDPSKLHLRSQDNALEWLTAKYVGKPRAVYGKGDILIRQSGHLVCRYVLFSGRLANVSNYFRIALIASSTVECICKCSVYLWLFFMRKYNIYESIKIIYSVWWIPPLTLKRSAKFALRKSRNLK